MIQLFVKFTPRIYEPDCRVQVRAKPLYGADVYWPDPCRPKSAN